MSSGGYAYQLETDSLEYVFIHIENMYNQLKEKIESHTIFIGKKEYKVLYKLK